MISRSQVCWRSYQTVTSQVLPQYFVQPRKCQLIPVAPAKYALRKENSGLSRRLWKVAAATQSASPGIPYEPISQDSQRYELRLYQPRYTVEIPYKSRDKAYLAFDRYLTGQNDSGLQLEAPSPVIMRHDPEAGEKTMQMFVVPLGTKPVLHFHFVVPICSTICLQYSCNSQEKSPCCFCFAETPTTYNLQDRGALLQQPPFPTDDRMMLNITGGEVIASLRFSGQATGETTDKACRKLKGMLEEDDIRLADAEMNGVFRLAQYDPVHSLKPQTNEVWLAVTLESD